VLLVSFKVHYDQNTQIKGIGYIFFLKNGLKGFCSKNYINHLGVNFEVCTAASRCIPDIL
jgi:hypothetical protein